MPKNNTNKVDKVARDESFVEGLKQHFAKKSLLINKENRKCDAIVAEVEQHITLVKATEQANARWRQAVAAERAKDEAITQLMRSVQALALATFGEASSEYTDFGFQPRRKRSQSPASKVTAAEKLRATRQARHTMGSKQRLQIKGTLISVPATSAMPDAASSVTAAGSATAQPLAVVSANGGTASGAVTNGAPTNGTPYAFTNGVAKAS